MSKKNLYLLEKKMAKKKQDDLWSELAQEVGGELLSESNNVVYFIDTGSLAINFICSCRYIDGGIPSGRITEVFGPSSSAKSLLAMNVLRGTQKMGGVPGILDCENATNAEFAAKASHLDVTKVIRRAPETLERSFATARNLIKKSREKFGKGVPIGIVYDSISVSPCEREFRETELPDNYTPAMFKKIVGGKSQPGERAKVCSAELRKINPILEKHNGTLFIINQVREKIGVMFGNPETTGGGGRSLEFYASLRLRTQSQKRIMDTKLNKSVGVNLKVQNKKNRACRPFIESEGIQLFFDAGINPLSGLLSILIQDERVIPGKGTYTVDSKYSTNGVEYKFKASLERNDVPEQVVLDCPALINAKNKEEVIEYLADYKEAISKINSADLAEVSVNSDDPDLEEITSVDEEELT